VDTAALIEYVRSHRDGVVATIGPNGAPQSAYLSLTATDRGELVFDARVDSRKVANILHDPRVAVVIGGADGTTLQCEGVADAPVGAERERCTAAYLATFPQFTDSLQGDSDSTGVVVVRITLSWARFGDFRDDRHDLSIVDLD
jgi:general stress protein 26